MIIFDVDSKDVSSGLAFPSRQFLSTDTLERCKRLLHPGGVLMVNFACRSSTLRDTILDEFRAVFDDVHQCPVPGSTNTILFGVKAISDAARMTPALLRKTASAVTACAARPWDECLDLGALVNGFKLNGRSNVAQRHTDAQFFQFIYLALFPPLCVRVCLGQVKRWMSLLLRLVPQPRNVAGRSGDE